MNKLRLIGDLHGDWTYYKDFLIEGCEQSLQVGDFGFGFNKSKDDLMLKWQRDNLDHLFIRGNHDDPAICKKSSNYIPDGGLFSEKIMTIGGAWSIDYYLRREGLNYWSDEENSQEVFDELEKQYLNSKPDVMITHDAPHGVPELLGLLNPDFGGSVATRTGYRLARMFSFHKPKLWVFGHWHNSADKVLRGTRFVCLNINEVRDLDLDTLELTGRLS